METLQDLWRLIVFTTVTLLWVAALRYFLPIFAYQYFFYVPLFLENHSSFFRRGYWNYCWLPHKKIPFHSVSSLMEAILRYFGDPFGVCFSFLENFSTLFYWILPRCFLYYSDIQCATKNFAARSSLLEHYPVLHILRNVKYSFDILHECLGITVAVIKLKSVLGTPLLCFWGGFGPFCRVLFI